jgi:diguanylate cyclase (GGDEF)-like protein
MMSAKLVQRTTVIALLVAAIGGALAAHLVAAHHLDSQRAERVRSAQEQVELALVGRAYYLTDIADMVGVHDDADVAEFTRYALVRGGGEQAIEAVQWIRRSPSGRLAPAGDVPPGTAIAEPLLVDVTTAADRPLANAADAPFATQTIRAASIGKRIAISAPVAFSDGAHGFYLAVPVEAKDSSGEVARLESRSAMVGLVDAEALVSQAFAGEEAGSVRLFDSGAELASVGPQPEDPISAPVPTPNDAWTVTVDGGSLTAFEAALPWLILVLGSGLALAVALALRGARRRRDTALRDLEFSLGRVERANHELEHARAEDSLTGVFNRRHFTEVLATELASTGAAEPAVLFLDLDHFKRVNDRYGHLTGDAVLRAAAERIASALRSSDCLARWGGEEFAVLAPAIGGEAMSTLAERIRRALAERPIDVDGVRIRLTLSVGAVLVDDAIESPDEAVAAADLALYEAKEGGRDCVCVWDPAAALSRP